MIENNEIRNIEVTVYRTRGRMGRMVPRISRNEYETSSRVLFMEIDFRPKIRPKVEKG